MVSSDFVETGAQHVRIIQKIAEKRVETDGRGEGIITIREERDTHEWESIPAYISNG